MPRPSSRVLVGIYAAAAVLILATLLASPSPTSQPASVASAVPEQPQEAGAVPLGIFPVVDDKPTTAPTTVAVVPKQPAAALAAVVPVEPTPALADPPPPPSATSTTQAKDTEDVNTDTRAALVNIFCMPQKGGPISGSGIIVDTRGVIVTNAHVGQFFLLQDALPEGRLDCTVRLGSPAHSKYHAKLLYISSAWINKNASQIDEKHPTGTGENDYAFLQITDSVDGSPLPESLPFVRMTTDRPHKGGAVLLAAYPAGFLENATIEKDLYITSAFTAVESLFTFDSPRQVDLVSVGGTVVSQSGASGGSVVRQDDGALLAIISTSSDGANTASRDLRAITVAHIDRALAAEGQSGITTLLNGDLLKKAADFNANVAPGLAKKLIDVLKH